MNGTDWNAWVIGLGLENVVAPAARLHGDGAFAWMLRGLHPATFERGERVAAYGLVHGTPRLVLAEGSAGSTCIPHSHVLYNGLVVSPRRGQKPSPKNGVGLPAVDERFCVEAFDRAAARGLLEGPLARCLLELTKEGFVVGLYDEMLRVSGPVENHRDFLALSSAATELNRATEAQLRMLPRTTSLEHVRVAWGRAASRRDLHYEAETLSMRGVFGRIVVEVALRSQGGLTYTEVAARHALPLPIPFALRLHNDMVAGRLWDEAGDTRVGDPVFDDRFLVRTARGDRAFVRTLLYDAAIRERLGALGASLASFYLGPEGVIAVRTWAIASEPELIALLDEVVALVQRFSADSSGPGDHIGPYR